MGAGVAANLLIKDKWESTSTPQPSMGSGPVPKPMNRESQARFVAVLLFLLTVAAVVCAGFNLQQESHTAFPTDKVWWVEHDGHLVAERLESGGPGAKAGIKANDQLVAINCQGVTQMSGVERPLHPTG